MSESLRRIGVLGGSFDPPHIGHITCSQIVAETLNLEQIILMPVATQPQRLGGTVASAESRFRMVEAIANIDPIFSASRLEIDSSGISYTVNTVDLLLKMYPLDKFQLYWIIGMDTAINLESWLHPDKITESVRFAVMLRPGYSESDVPNKWKDFMTFIQTPQIDISSTIIRQRITSKLPIGSWVGADVENVILSERLYIG